MEPISVILAVLAAGATAAAKDTAGTAVKDTYEGLKKLIVKRFAEKGKAEDIAIVEKHERKPDSGAVKELLKEELIEVGVDRDLEVQKIAEKLLEIVKAEGSASEGSGKTTVNIKALPKHVEAIYTELSDGERKATREIFLTLLDVETDRGLGTWRKVVSKRAKRSEFRGELIQATLTKLIDHNLLASDRSETTIEIAPEILLTSWDTLRQWIEEVYRAIALRNDILKNLDRWQETKRKAPNNVHKHYVTRSLLEEARKTRDEKTFEVLGGLTPEENQFIDDSFAYSERRRKEKLRTARGIAGVSLAAAVMSIGFRAYAWWPTGKILRDHHTTNLEMVNALPELPALPKAPEPDNGTEQNRLTGHKDAVTSVALTPDGKTLVSGSADNTIKVWNLETGVESRTLTGHKDAVMSVALTPDGKTLVSGSWDNTIKVWNLETGGEPRTLTGHQGLVTSVAITPDGKALISGSKDKTIKVWDFDVDSLLGRSCDWVRDYLQNPSSDVRPDDRHLCDGIGKEK
ncbi:WD40 repeat domain-containing protein [Pannus brasiliensis CCIBt3594]|uniref:WD40 repeat domain-containing protein n=1 Tax=Pannus brasiliensis CCIBt3594 TaxID=1427578 RepID=A0AAW9QTR3_9CHRO